MTQVDSFRDKIQNEVQLPEIGTKMYRTLARQPKVRHDSLVNSHG